MKFCSTNERETIDLAKKLAKSVKHPCVIVLKGDLGAGKTHFVKGFAKGLKSKALVTSPTFTIMNVYEGGRLPIYHFDMYRLEGAAEAEALGFEEYFDKANLKGVSIVEWPENVGWLIGQADLEIEIKKTGENKREIQIKGESDACNFNRNKKSVDRT